MSKIVKAMAKQEKQKLSGKFEVVDRDPMLDKMVMLRGDKSRLLYQLAQDLKAISGTKTLSLGTDEDFIRTWGPLKTSKAFIRHTLKQFGVDKVVVAQHEGKVLVWTR